jgi:hypothetical protein
MPSFDESAFRKTMTLLLADVVVPAAYSLLLPAWAWWLSPKCTWPPSIGVGFCEDVSNYDFVKGLSPIQS